MILKVTMKYTKHTYTELARLLVDIYAVSFLWLSLAINFYDKTPISRFFRSGFPTFQM